MVRHGMTRCPVAAPVVQDTAGNLEDIGFERVAAIPVRIAPQAYEHFLRQIIGFRPVAQTAAKVSPERCLETPVKTFPNLLLHMVRFPIPRHSFSLFFSPWPQHYYIIFEKAFFCEEVRNIATIPFYPVGVVAPKRARLVPKGHVRPKNGGARAWANLDAKALKVFETVARCESMKRAATELHTVQSNVTARIRQLEQELGVTLFERRPNGMKLTPAGTRLLPHAFEVRAAVTNAKRAIEEIGIPKGPLTIGSRKTTSALHLTRILEDYIEAHPAVDVRVRTETSPLLTQQVLERKIEGALVCNTGDHPDLESEMILDEELVICTARGVASLGQIPRDTRLFVLGQGSTYEQQLKRVLAREGIATNRVVELGTLENIIGCVGSGLGVTLFQRGILEMAGARDLIRAHPVPGADCRARTVFIRRRDGFVSSALAAFLDCARSYARTLKAAA